MVSSSDTEEVFSHYPPKVGSANNAMEWKEYRKHREQVYERLDKYLTTSARCCLDIGCGLAIETELLQKQTQCELYLMEGDAASSNPCGRLTGYGSVDTMRFYLPVSELRRSWDSRKINYTFVDARDPQIPARIVFDLIYSFRSCGFHYPLETYEGIIRKHSDANTRLVFDLRKGADQGDTYFSVVEVIADFRKSRLCSIKLGEPE